MPRPCRSHDTTSKVVLQTVAAYEQSVDKYLSRRGRQRYRQSLLLRIPLRRWLAFLPKQARLLDLGRGVGQDARHLCQEGNGIVGLDRTGAISICPAACTFRFVVLADMRWISPHRGSVDGIWAAASMIHLPESAVRVVLVDLLDVI
jgi:SAM-dependent methyltransferase